ncbi:MAG: bifunctional glutamate N-acetyltransferase/amino-acid acetyltransferase ArgJ [Deltaproteobacteria bacterium]|nr:bifunctional glutamate N-acetyltransferase/amino-acid acetyltransferase ArgJ [Deltaproteobacteria bacterium]
MTATIRSITGGVTAPAGFQAAGLACGIKKDNTPDLALLFSDRDAAAAGVFTRNRVVAAPVVWTRKILRKEKLRAVIVNSGNANACTGRRGKDDTTAMAAETARCFNLCAQDIAVASTGVIGQPLPMEKILPAIPLVAAKLSGRGNAQAARAILTTDTFPKSKAVEIREKTGRFRIGGIAKGSGMIHPDMATMLAFFTTDAAIAPALLKKALRTAVDRSFHRITVDGDTSTNDTVLILANGASGIRIEEGELISSGFQKALNGICLELAQEIVKDGEGATKFITLRVIHGRKTQECLKIAKAIATSSLVKTALFGEDANWGRILSSAGTAGVPFRPESVDIYFGDIQIVKGGCPSGAAEEKEAARLLKKRKIQITVDLNLGTAETEVYTSDLSYDYVRINAEYRS